MKVTYLAKAEESVDNILRKRLKMSHRVIKENENRVFVNGVHFNRRDIVGIGDKVEIELIQDIPIDERFINKYKCTSQKLDIIYEDDYILAVNKSAGMPVHPSINNYTNTYFLTTILSSEQYSITYLFSLLHIKIPIVLLLLISLIFLSI